MQPYIARRKRRQGRGAVREKGPGHVRSLRWALMPTGPGVLGPLWQAWAFSVGPGMGLYWVQNGPQKWVQKNAWALGPIKTKIIKIQ